MLERGPFLGRAQPIGPGPLKCLSRRPRVPRGGLHEHVDRGMTLMNSARSIEGNDLIRFQTGFSHCMAWAVRGSRYSGWKVHTHAMGEGCCGISLLKSGGQVCGRSPREAFW